MGRISRWVGVVLVCFAMVGCGDFKAGLEDAQATRDAIQSELGTDASVNFNVFHGPGGKKTIVSVRLAKTPPGDAAAIKTRVRSIVDAHFRTHVDDVRLSM